jgi:uncharacterized protein involved in exopolysaccharide biosynthesis/Mrp family chromosome partitioning ATPase
VNIRFIIGLTLGAVAAMLIYLQFVTPVYTAFSQVILDTREERVTPVEEVVSNLNVTNSVIAGEVVMLRSNVLIGKVVDRLDLVNRPAFDPRMPRPEALFARAKRFARQGEPPHVVAASLPPETLRSWVIDSVRRNLGVTQIGVSYAIGINYKSSDPRLAAEIANAVANQYIDSQLENKMDATVRANAWLSDRLLELSEQVQSADGAVVDFKAGMIETAGGNEESINQLLAELNTRLVGSSTERADAEVRLGQVEALELAGGLVAVADVVTSPLLETLQQQRTALASTRAQMGSTLGRKHPDMIRIAAQIADIDRSIEAELKRRVEEMRSDVVVTRNREDALRAQISLVSERADSLSKASVRLSQLERTAEATRAVYENFLSRYKETSAQADFQVPEARVIGRADVPVVPTSPRKTLFVVISFLFGLSLAIAVVFIRNLVRAPVTTSAELRSLTQRQVMAPLPYVRHFGGKYKWLRREVTGRGTSSFMERIRSIRIELFEVSRISRPRIVLVTSSVPGEGKTSMACALASDLSGPKSSVLLLDADLRRPDVHKALDMPAEGGCLVSYLERGDKMKDLPRRSELIGADVIGPHRPSSDAADLLTSNLFSGLLSRMSSRYDVIIVNAPPVLHLADSMLLAKHADATLYAVRSGSTPANVVRRSIQRLEGAGAVVAGVVMTMVRRKDAAARESDMYSYEY